MTPTILLPTKQRDMCSVRDLDLCPRSLLDLCRLRVTRRPQKERKKHTSKRFLVNLATLVRSQFVSRAWICGFLVDTKHFYPYIFFSLSSPLRGDGGAGQTFAHNNNTGCIRQLPNTLRQTVNHFKRKAVNQSIVQEASHLASQQASHEVTQPFSQQVSPAASQPFSQPSQSFNQPQSHAANST